MSQGDDRSSNLAFSGIDSLSPICFLRPKTGIGGKEIDGAPRIFSSAQ